MQPTHSAPETLRDLKTGRVIATTHFASFGALVEGRWSWIKDCMMRRYGCAEDELGCTEDEFGNDLITLNGVPVACLGDMPVEYAADVSPSAASTFANASANEELEGNIRSAPSAPAHSQALYGRAIDLPAGAVSTTAQHLQSTVSTLWKLRLDPDTANDVLKEEGALLAALGTLRSLCEDIRVSHDGRE